MFVVLAQTVRGGREVRLEASARFRQRESIRLQIEYPDALPDSLQTTRPRFEVEARMAPAAKMFELKRLSSGLAGRLAGVSRVGFLLNLHRFGVPVLDLDEEELPSDVAHA